MAPWQARRAEDRPGQGRGARTAGADHWEGRQRDLPGERLDPPPASRRVSSAFLVIAACITLRRRYHLNVLQMSQLKRTGSKVLLKGGALEDAIAAAITAMNEPKTCSTTILRRYLLDANKDRKQYQLGRRRACVGGVRVTCVRYRRLSTRWR